MQIDKNIVLKRKDKKPILIDTYFSKDIVSQPIVIFCHGYKGFKDWGAWNIMAETIANAGFCFIKFNFSHNGGTMDNPIDFPDLDAFGHNNYTIELNDLNAIIDWIVTHFENNSNIDKNQINLVGHSRGGGIAILKSLEDTRITKLITLAGVSNFGSRFGTENEIQRWKEAGVKYVLNGRTKQRMPHYYQFFEDYKANKERLDIKLASKALKIPMLVIHGDNDTSVSIEEAKALKQWNPASQFEIIKGADHVFNTKHPWDKETLSSELETVVTHILNFIT